MKSVYFLSYVFIVVITTGCISITSIQRELDMDPDVPTPINGNEEIIIYQTSFDCLINGFLSNRYRITQENEERGYFNCEKVADNGTYIRHMVRLVDSVGTVTTEFKPSSNEIETRWTPSKYQTIGGNMSYSILSGLNAVAGCGSIRFN